MLVSLGAASRGWPLAPEVISSFLSPLFVSWALCAHPEVQEMLGLCDGHIHMRGEEEQQLEIVGSG